MLDPTVQEIGVGGVVAVVLVATVMKFLPAFMAALRQQNNNHHGKKEVTAGEKTPDFWIAEQEKAALKAIKTYVESEDFRKTMQSIVGDWLDMRLNEPRRRNQWDKR